MAHIPPVLENPTNLDARIRSLAEARSDSGFLTLYETVDFHDQPRWRAHARTRLAKTQEHVLGDHTHRERARAAVGRAQQVIEWLPVEMTSRSIAGFLDLDDVAGDRDVWLEFDVPTTTSVTIGAHPRIAPLLHLRDLCAPVGVVRWSKDVMVIDEWHAGNFTSVASHRAEIVENDRLKVGPATTSPGHMNQSILQRERFERSIRVREVNALADWGTATLRRLVRLRRWSHVLLFGPSTIDAQLIHALAGRVDVIDAGHDTLVNEPHGSMLQRVRATLSNTRRDRRARLLTAFAERRPTCVTGVDKTARALRDGRVDRLLVVDAAGDDDTAVDRRERFVRQALAQRGDVSLLNADEASALGLRDGIAATVRYTPATPAPTR